MISVGIPKVFVPFKWCLEEKNAVLAVISVHGQEFPTDVYWPITIWAKNKRRKFPGQLEPSVCKEGQGKS